VHGGVPAAVGRAKLDLGGSDREAEPIAQRAPGFHIIDEAPDRKATRARATATADAEQRHLQRAELRFRGPDEGEGGVRRLGGMQRRWQQRLAALVPDLVHGVQHIRTRDRDRLAIEGRQGRCAGRECVDVGDTDQHG
jgi:hypothetical protein